MTFKQFINILPDKLFGFSIGVVYMMFIFGLIDLVGYLLTLVSNVWIQLIMSLGLLFLILLSFNEMINAMEK